METCSAPGNSERPVYIYNGMVNLQDLKEVNLNGANLFFNGSFSLEDLRVVNLLGASVFLNGELQSTIRVGHSPEAKNSEIVSDSDDPGSQQGAGLGDEQKNGSPSVDLTIRTSPKTSATKAYQFPVILRDKQAQSQQNLHQSQPNLGFCGSTAPDAIPINTEITTQPAKPLPRNPNYTPLGPGRNFALRSCEPEQERTSVRKSGCLQPLAPPVQFNARTVVANPMPSHTQDANTGILRAEKQRERLPRSTSFSSIGSRRWSHDLAEAPNKLTPQKRPAAYDVPCHSANENKKPRLEMHNNFQADKQTEELVHAEAQRGANARHLSDSGSRRGATAEYEKIRKLSNQRNDIRSQLIGKPHRPSITPNNPFTFSGVPSTVPQHTPILPYNSPLNNVINSASLQEEIVQARIKYNIAQSELLKQKASHRGVSRGVLAQVTRLNTTLAVLKKRRAEITEDANRMGAFRRTETTRHEYDAKAPTKTTPGSPPLSPTDSEYKSRLTLCYEALVREEPYHETAKTIKKESVTMSAEEEPMIKQEPNDHKGMPRVEKAEQWASKVPERRQVRFALTDVETFLEQFKGPG